MDYKVLSIVLLAFLIEIALADNGGTCAPGVDSICLQPSQKDACKGRCVQEANCVKSKITGQWECQCRSGFRGDGTTRCADIDECAEGLHDCGPNAVCINIPGYFKCECKEGALCDPHIYKNVFNPNEVVSHSFGTQDKFELKPPLLVRIRQNDPSEWRDPGWILRKDSDQDLHVVFDLPKGVRDKVVGYYIIKYQVVDDYDRAVFDTRTRVVIVDDIDECVEGSHKCSPYADCINTNGSYTCRCRAGFVGDGFNCGKEDPCKGLDRGCHPLAECVADSTPRGYHCVCRRGYEGDGFSCVDVDECRNPQLYHCPPHSRCVNLPGTYTCECERGWEKAPSQEDMCAPGEVPCIDIDECVTNLHDCHRLAQCTNLPGSYRCDCREGYIGDGRTDCRKVYGFNWELLGPNPLKLRQCDEYTEYSVKVDDRGAERARVKTDIPRELSESLILARGHYVVNYSLTDQEGQAHRLSRVVIVEGINPCEVPKGQPCSHNCVHPATCVYDPSLATSHWCKCPVGYEPTPDGGCAKLGKPELILQGMDPYIRYVCKVCEMVVQYSGDEFDETKHGGYTAWEVYPDGSKIDLTGRVVSRFQRVNDSFAWMIYSVRDDYGNEVTRQRRIITVEEDKYSDIEEMKRLMMPYLRAQVLPELKTEAERTTETIVLGYISTWWYYLRLAIELLCVFTVIILLLAFLPAIWNASQVLYDEYVTGRKMKLENYIDAYLFLYTFTHPFWSKQKRERVAHQNYHKRFHDH